MSAYGIASFVEGFFNGRNIKQSEEDRKLDRERQKKIDQLAFDRAARDAERFGWERQERQDAASEKAWEEDLFRRAYEESQEPQPASSQPAPAQVPGAATPASPQSAGATLKDSADAYLDGMISAPDPKQGQTAPSQEAQGVAAQLGVSLGARPSPAAAVMERTMPAEELGARAASAAAERPGPRVPDAMGILREQMERNGQPVQGPMPARPRPEIPRDIIARDQAAAPAPPPKITDAEVRVDSDAASIDQQINQAYARLMTAERSLPPPDQRTPANTAAYRAAEAELRGLYARKEAAAPQPDAMGATRPRPDVRAEMQRELDRRAPNYGHDFGQAGGMAADVAEVGNRAIAAAETIPGVVAGAAYDAAATAAGVTNKVVDPWVKYATGYEFGAPPPRAAGTSTAPSPAQIAAPAPGPAATDAPQAPRGPLKTAVPQSAPAPTKQIAETAVETLGATGPATQAAVSAPVTTEEAGARPNAAVTADRQERASTAFLDRYREVGVPMIIDGYLKAGKLEKAQAFMDWMEQGEVKAGMRDWSKAAFAASVGDFDGFADHIVTAYNRLDYFGDDTTIVKDKSGFVDANGKIINGGDGSNIAGAVLTFRDEKTGATFEQRIDDPNDLVEMGISMLAPETAFEYWQDRSAQAEERALGAAKEEAAAAKEAAKEAREAEKDRVKRISERAQKIVEGGFGQITMEEAIQQAVAAEEELDRALKGAGSLGDVGASSAPPVLRRPAN